MGRDKATFVSYPPQSIEDPTVMLDQTIVTAEDSDASLAGSQFATFILEKAKLAEAEMAAGLNVPRKKEMKYYPPFRQTFFQDTRFLPALSYTHICYEFDAQFGEMDKHWKRAGKKFSDEPARGKPKFSAENGPKIPVEWPRYAEREQKVFGAKRKINPFSTSKKYTAPLDRCTLPYKPTSDEAVSHLGPGIYRYPDHWKGEKRSNDGNIAGTQAFLSGSKSVAQFETHWDRVHKEEPMLAPDRPSSRAFHQQITGSPTRVRSPADFSRSVINASLMSTTSASNPEQQQQMEREQMQRKQMQREQQESVLSPVNTSMSKNDNRPPLSRAESTEPQPIEFTDSMESLGEDAAVQEMTSATATATNTADLRSRTASRGGERGASRSGSRARSRGTKSRYTATLAQDSAIKEDFLSLGTKDKVQSLQYLSSSMSNPALFKFLVGSQFSKNAPGKQIADQIPQISRGEAQTAKKPMTINEKNKIAGVSIGRGKPGKSSLDIITGSTDADKSFKRLVLRDGDAIIYPMNQDSNASNMPQGACFTDSWGHTDIYAEKDSSLAVVAETANMHPASPKVHESAAGPAGVIGKLGPIWVEKTRPATADVSVALPSPLSGPRTPVDPNAWMPPKIYKRGRANTAAGTRARNQARSDADFPLRGFPVHLKHRLKDSPSPRQSPDPNVERAATASVTQNTRGILAGKSRGTRSRDSLGTSTPKREKSSQMLQAFFDQEVDSLASKFEP